MGHRDNPCIVHRSENVEQLLRKNVSLLCSKNIDCYLNFIKIHLKRFQSMRRLTETLQELSWLLTGIKNGVADGGKSTTEIVTTGAQSRSHRTKMHVCCAFWTHKPD